MNRNNNCVYLELIGEKGGMEQYNRGFITALSSVYGQVVAIVPTKNIFKKNVELHSNYNLKMTTTKVKKLILVWMIMLTFRKILRHDNNYDVFIHIFHQNIFEILKVLFVSKYSNSLYVVYHDLTDLHEVKKTRYRKIISLFLNKCCEKFARKVFTHSYHADGTILKHTRVALERLPHVDKGDCNFETDKEDIIFYYGNFVKHSEFNATITALRNFALSHPNFRVVIMGRLTEEQVNYHTSLERNRVTPNLYVEKKYIDESELSKLLNVAKFVILPYKVVYSSGVLLRTISHGCIPICLRNKEFSAIPCLSKLMYENSIKLESKVAEVNNFRVSEKRQITNRLREFSNENSVESLAKKISHSASEKAY